MLIDLRSQSVDNELHRMDTPSKRTPVFGSIERGLDKVKTIFTPRKRLNVIDTPRKAKVFKIYYYYYYYYYFAYHSSSSNLFLLFYSNEFLIQNFKNYFFKCLVTYSFRIHATLLSQI